MDFPELLILDIMFVYLVGCFFLFKAMQFPINDM